jgi:hypothetical protein
VAQNAVMRQMDAPVRRFGPDFVAAHRRRYGNRPAQQRQLTYDIAVLDEYASWRDWVDQELALLPADAIAENQSLSDSGVWGDAECFSGEPSEQSTTLACYNSSRNCHRARRNVEVAGARIDPKPESG